MKPEWLLRRQVCGTPEPKGRAPQRVTQVLTERSNSPLNPRTFPWLSQKISQVHGRGGAQGSLSYLSPDF